MAEAYAPDKVHGGPPDTARGDVEAGCTTPWQHHNPMEPHATLARWEGEMLSIEDSKQHVAGVRRTLAAAFGISPDRVRDLPITLDKLV